MPRNAKPTAATRKTSGSGNTYTKQNQLGLSYSGMIVLALRNSDARIKNDFFDRALTVQDIYGFLRAHVEAFEKMSTEEWKKTQKVVRHSLAQATFFTRFDHGEGRVVGRGGGDRGGLWTLHPAGGESEEKARKRIDATLKRENVAKFQRNLVNGDLLGGLLDGTYGWRNPFSQPLADSEAKKKTKKPRKDAEQQPTPITVIPVPAQRFSAFQTAPPAQAAPINFVATGKRPQYYFPAVPTATTVLPRPTESVPMHQATNSAPINFMPFGYRPRCPVTVATLQIPAEEPKKRGRKAAAVQNELLGEVVVQNVVATANLGLRTTLNLQKVARRLPNSQYEPKAHNACRLQLRNPIASVLLFASGRIIVTGLKRVEDCRKSARKVGRILMKLGYAPRWRECDFRITNITASVNLETSIDLEVLASRHRNCTYEPEQFSGAKFQLDNPKLTFVVFRNGKINMLGARTVEQIHEGFEKIRPIFEAPRPAVEAPNHRHQPEVQAPTAMEPEFEFPPTAHYHPGPGMEPHEYQEEALFDHGAELGFYSVPETEFSLLPQYEVAYGGFDDWSFDL